MGYKSNKKKGFTLVEIIICLSVFSILMVILSGIFLTNYRIQKKTHAVQKTLGEVSYTTEYISRLARMARSNDGECFDEEDYTYYSGEEEDELTFIDYKKRCVTFKEEDGRIVMDIMGEDPAYLTSENISINDFQVEVSPDPLGNGELHKEQPSTTIFFKVEERMTHAREDPFGIHLQTTITRRGIDFQ